MNEKCSSARDACYVGHNVQGAYAACVWVGNIVLNRHCMIETCFMCVFMSTTQLHVLGCINSTNCIEYGDIVRTYVHILI